MRTFAENFLYQWRAIWNWASQNDPSLLPHIELYGNMLRRLIDSWPNGNDDASYQEHFLKIHQCIDQMRIFVKKHNIPCT